MKKTILIVEDEEVLSNVLKAEVEKAGYGVLTANDGEQGLQLALKEHPDLILLDIVTPKMDGLTVLRELRKDEDWGKKAEVILLTNVIDEESVAQAIEQGAFEYIAKSSVKMKDIVERIKSKLED